MQERSDQKKEPDRDDGEVAEASALSANAADGSEMKARMEEMRNEVKRQVDEMRERLNRSADERALHSKTQFIDALLPVFDNLYRSLEAAHGSGSKESLLHGLERTVRGFESALGGIGVEPVRSVGEIFNPEVHEAVDAVEVRSVDDNVVTREYSRGYRLGDRLLRPARVQVGRARIAKANSPA